MDTIYPLDMGRKLAYNMRHVLMRGARQTSPAVRATILKKWNSPMLLKQKIARVRDVYDIACSLDAEMGEPILGRGSHSTPESRRIEFRANTILLLHPGRFIKMGWGNGHTIREITEFREGCVALEVYRFGKAVMQANILTSNEVDIHRYEPGGWEINLGFAPNGDTLPILPHLFVDENNPHFMAWLEKNPRPAHGSLVRP